MKIAFFEVEEFEEGGLKKQLEEMKKKFPSIDFDISFYREILSSENIGKAKGCDVVSVFIYSKLTSDIIKKLKAFGVKLIATRSTGFNHIDLKECKSQGIVVSNVPCYGSVTVAEYTFALILALSRKIVTAVERTRKGNFSIEGLRGFDLMNKTIGVVGTGRIGREVMRIAKGFGMNIICFDKFKNPLVKNFGAKYVELDYLLENSDIITLHLPLNDETKHIINSGNITKIKKNAFLINTARGGLVETDALIKGINEGVLKGAALDVLEEETLIKEEKELLTKHYSPRALELALKNNLLLKKENVLITPHNAFNSEEAINNIIRTTVDNISSFLSGKPVNVVNP